MSDCVIGHETSYGYLKYATADNRDYLSPELNPVANVNAWAQHNSPSRGAMLTAEIAQAVVITKSGPNRISTGTEYEFAKATFSQTFKNDCIIHKVIHKFPENVHRDGIRHNPLTVIIYRNEHDHSYGLIELNRYHCTHPRFGFEFERTPEYDKLYPGAAIRAGTTVAKSPQVSKDGRHFFGRPANLLLTSDPSVIEDGSWVSDEFLAGCTPTCIETRSISISKDQVLVNTYGNESVYKGFADVGETILSSGLVFAARKVDPDLSIANMSRRALMQVDYIYDDRRYGDAGAMVVDVTVRCDAGNGFPLLPDGTDAQLKKYYDAQLRFHKSILDCYNELNSKHAHGTLKITPEFHRYVVDAIHYTGTGTNGREKVCSIYRGSAIPGWTIDIKYISHPKPNTGFKLAGLHGNKTVVTRSSPRSQMPRDANGNIADIVMCEGAVTRRTIAGVQYEQGVNAAGRDLAKSITKELGLVEGMSQTQIKAFFDNPSNLEAIRAQMARLFHFYTGTAPLMCELWESPEFSETDKIDCVREAAETALLPAHDGFIRPGIQLFMPMDNPMDRPGIIDFLAKHYRPIETPITFTNLVGEEVTTVDSMMIGETYFMVLEKIADDGSAVASSPRGPFGTVVRPTNQTKYNSPIKATPTRVAGEAEVRSMAATMVAPIQREDGDYTGVFGVGPGGLYDSVADGRCVADIVDLANNPTAHRVVQQSILRADTPGCIEVALPRDLVPIGGNRPLRFAMHMLEMGGIEYYRPK